MKPQYFSIGRYGRLIYIPTDRFKSELLSLSFVVPLTADTAQKNAMLIALSRRGTVSYPTQTALNRHLDGLYSTAISTSNRRLGEMQQITMTADFLGARFVGGGRGLLPEVVSLLHELLCCPLTDGEGCYQAAYVAGEKQVLRDAIRAAINNPRGYALTKARELLCAGEPYALSLIGEEKTVNALTPAALTARHRALLSEIAPLFCYVGATPPEAVCALLESRFATVGAPAASFVTDVKAHEGATRYGEEEMPISQGKLVLGFRTDVGATHSLAPATVLLNEIYGGSPASKLFMNVREKLGLCYHCSSAYQMQKGIMMANCGIKLSNRSVAEEAMQGEFEAVRRGHISKTEMEAAALSTVSAYRSAFDNPAALARFYIARAHAGVDEGIEQWRERLAAVTREQVVEAAQHFTLGAVFFLKGTDTEEGLE
ncbi:MAG: insulinase family protein [Ruminococcaceae bacterium]|nr:insulinase family protein [Oscillospiraceae bacterium]